MWQALVPTTAQFGHQARVIVSSTPWVRTVCSFRFTSRPPAATWLTRLRTTTTAEANPTIGADYLASEEARDPDAYKAEYLAEFTGSGAAYLDLDAS